MKQALEVEIPGALDYLEAQLPDRGFCFGEPSIADVSLAAFFRTAAFARFRVDAGRWPRTAAFVERVLALPGFQRLAPLEDAMLRTPIPQQREMLRGLGAPIAAETLAAGAPRRGLMPI